MVVVLGPGAGEIGRVVEETVRRAASGAMVRAVVNDLPDSDMASSVRTGLAAIRPDATGVLVFPADHPLVAPATVRSLIDSHRAAPSDVVIPVIGAKRGHPTLFPADFLRVALTEGRTLRDLVRDAGDAVTLLEVDDEGVVLDVDTLEDYRRILGMTRGGAR